MSYRLAVLALVSCLSPAAADGPLTIDLKQAIELARKNSPQLQSATIDSILAREDRVQARAAMLPSLSYDNAFIYTQPKGPDSWIFVSNDGTHVYNSQATVHGDIFAPGKRAEYRRAQAAEAVAKAKVDIADRGLVATVVQDYYAVAAAGRKAANAVRAVDEARRFLDITTKQERAGEAAHSDVLKAEIVLQQRERDGREAALAVEKSRIALGVLLFTDYTKDFSVVDDLDSLPPLPALDDVRLRAKDSPEVRAARAAVQQEESGIASARSGMLPSLGVDYLYGINANQFAIYDPEHFKNLGSSFAVGLTIPIFDWGAARSRVRQARMRRDQANLELKFSQKQLAANLDSYYAEAEAARAEIDSLRHSLDLAADSLRLTTLRYEAGEVSVLEVVDAQSTLVDARNACDDGLARYRLALANLQTLTGTY
jgi:outer membrane protein TolC